ncbi:MAG: hypothetical protein ACRD29_01415 [Acidimicrobiales bacterium]
MHVRWEFPAGVVRDTGKRRVTSVQSLAVGDEPSPFWNGIDAGERVASWTSSASPEWGVFANDPKLNGPSGQALDKRYLDILGIDRTEAWITDCLDKYCGSDGQHSVVDFYSALSDSEGSLPPVNLAPHPDTKAIERLALEHTDRLAAELELCQPDEVITLGVAACTVFARLVDLRKDGPSRLTPSPSSYGRPVVARRRGRTMRWWPLAHPATPKVYRDAHDAWMSARGL